MVAHHVALLQAGALAGPAVVNLREVREVFTAAGARNIATVIQSENVLFEADAEAATALVASAERALAEWLGDKTDVMCRSVRELEAVVACAPFRTRPEKLTEKLHVVFLASKPSAGVQLPLVSAQEALEVLAVRDREVFVLSARRSDGFFGCPIQFAEAAFGVRAMSRNWTAVKKILAALQAREA